MYYAVWYRRQINKNKKTLISHSINYLTSNRSKLYPIVSGQLVRPTQLDSIVFFVTSTAICKYVWKLQCHFTLKDVQLILTFIDQELNYPNIVKLIQRACEFNFQTKNVIKFLITKIFMARLVITIRRCWKTRTFSKCFSKIVHWTILLAWSLFEWKWVEVFHKIKALLNDYNHDKDYGVAKRK